MSANPLEALQAARDVMARVAELEAERNSLQAQLTQFGFVVEKAKELEAEVEKLRDKLEVLVQEADAGLAAEQMRCEEAEAKLAEVEKERDELRRYRLWAASSIERARELAENQQHEPDRTLVSTLSDRMKQIARLLSGKAEDA